MEGTEIWDHNILSCVNEEVKNMLGHSNLKWFPLCHKLQMAKLNISMCWVIHAEAILFNCYHFSW